MMQKGGQRLPKSLDVHAIAKITLQSENLRILNVKLCLKKASAYKSHTTAVQNPATRMGVATSVFGYCTHS